MSFPRSPLSIAIIGGGFSGAATAYQLVTQANLPLQISIYEPRAALGAGLAYSTADPVHRINVPAHRMTLIPEDEAHFHRWLMEEYGLTQWRGPAGDDEALLPDGRCFPARRLFGAYVDAQLRGLTETGKISHLRSRVERLEAVGEQWRIHAQNDGSAETAHAEPRLADVVIIATSHPPPQPPSLLAKAFGSEPKFIANPWAEDALSAIGKRDRILIVGTGLTMADMVATLDRLGHEGPITAISRRGQRSRSHAETAVEPYGDFINPPAKSALQLLHNVRRAIQPDQPWQGLFDQLRTQGGPIWQALNLEERRRFIRHLRPFWDTHRFRIAPQVGALLDEKLKQGELQVKAASLQSAQMDGEAFSVNFRSRAGEYWQESFDAVIATTGPGHGEIIHSQKFLAHLAQHKALAVDPTGLGLAVDEQSHLLGPDGSYPNLYVVGPLARGTFGELMGLPEVSNHAQMLARHIQQHHVRRDRADDRPQRSAKFAPLDL